ncbi:MAG: CDP-alcohol phosphatidyltransferase family protein [Ignavibacteria bacterium]
MEIIKEYKASLKGYDVEEILDLLIYRPISFIIVKLIYKFKVTPNQISLLSMFLGIAAGVLFAFDFYLYGAITLFVSNVFDCVDGQLARLKHNGTKIGRIIDGAIDYVTGASVFMGVGISLAVNSGDYFITWVIVILAALSRIFQNFFFDYYRNEYLSYVYNKVANLEDEIQEFRGEKKRLESEKGKVFEKLLIDIYIKYSKLQRKSNNHKVLTISPEEYKRTNRFILRLWSWLGSTTHLTLIIIFAIVQHIEIYLIATIVVGNFFMLVFLAYQSYLSGRYITLSRSK